MRLFLSEQCTGDNDADYESPQERERYAQRRKDPGIPADAEHQSKPDIALNLIEQAVAAGVDHGYIVTDRNSGRFPNHMLSKSHPRSFGSFLKIPISSIQTIILTGNILPTPRM